MKSNSEEKMNTRIFGAMAVAAAAFVLAGCIDDFLTREPQGVESESVFWKDENQAQKALIGAYDVSGWGATTEMYEWMIGDIASDDAEKGGEGPHDFKEVEDIRNFAATADNAVLAERWQALYVGVGRANQVIEKVPAMPWNAFKDGTADGGANGTSATRDRIVAEAKFLRGFYYFMLYNTFGPVPLVVKVPTRAEYCTPRADSASVWAQIVKDFTEAAAALPEKAATEAGRATKGAANGMLAKAYVYMQKWTEAAAAADAVITSGIYGTEADFGTVFTEEKENGLESIFEVQHTDDGTTDWGDDNEGTITSIFQGPRENSQPGAEVGWGFNIPTQDLFAAYDSLDVRRKHTILKVGDTLWPGHVPDTLKPVAVNPRGYYNRKYFWEYNEPDSPPAMSNDPKNWRVMRFTDLMLLRAEAAAHLGQFDRVKFFVDSVRSRTGLPDITQPDGAGTALDIVYKERRLELALEGQRYWDVVRTGRGVALLGRGYTENKRYMPIPQIEIDKCPALTQNPY